VEERRSEGLDGADPMRDVLGAGVLVRAVRPACDVVRAADPSVPSGALPPNEFGTTAIRRTTGISGVAADRPESAGRTTRPASRSTVRWTVASGEPSGTWASAVVIARLGGAESER
jgi:hypothetical protein